MNLNRSLLPVLPLIIGALGEIGSSIRADAGQTYTFVIAPNDGYGVQDCLAGLSECGQVVADAWCVAHGHGAAISFGLQSAIPGGVARKISATSDPYVINCGI